MIDEKVLVLDIETTPILAYVWGLKDQNIGLNQIKDDWQIVAWAAKWLHKPASSVMYLDKRSDDTDEHLLLGLWNLLNEATVVITQNGKSFDGPKINARFIYYKMPPPSPYKHLDTYLIARHTAQFTSNKLEYLTDKLCIKYKKLAHSKYPGMSLWTECLKGNVSAWNEMKKYNIRDVLATEELYMRLRAWTPKSSPDIYHHPALCPVCGSDNVQHRGTEIKKTGRYKRLHCQKCGKWSLGLKIKELK